MARVELVGVSHAYQPGEWAVRDVDVVWEDGVASALLGPSGCGKTTLLKIISGLLKPTEGRVLLDGVDVTDLDPRRRDVAQVFQFPVVYETLDVYDNLAFPLRNRGVPEATVRERVTEIADLLDLGDVLRRNAARLGAAEKQRISMGRGIVRFDTTAVLFDEPLTVIDPQGKWHLRRKLKQLHRRLGLTMIYVTHDQHEALTFADQVTVMNAGRALQTGTPRELHERPRHPFVGYFIGSPGMNVFPAERDGNVLRVGDLRLPVPEGMPDGDREGRVEVGVRPEFVEVARGPAPDAFACRVAAVVPTGSADVLELAGGGLRFKARVDEAFGAEVGDEVHARFPRRRTMVYAGGRALELAREEEAA